MTQTSPRPSRHKKLISIMVLLALLGVGLVLYAMYSSGRNDADGAADRRSAAVTATPQNQLRNTKAQPQEPAQPASTPSREISVKLYADSGSDLVNTVQTVVNYPADRLQFVAVTNGSAFPQEIATDSSAPGKLRIARAVNGQESSVKGAQLVATVTFRNLSDVQPAAAPVVDLSQSYLVTSQDNRNLIGNPGRSLYFR